MTGHGSVLREDCLKYGLALTLLLSPALAAPGDDQGFVWAPGARATAPDGWVAGAVIGFDPASGIAVLAAYPAGDIDPAAPGRALQITIDPDGRPLPATTSLRDRLPTEHRWFRENKNLVDRAPFVPAAGLPAGITACSTAAWSNDRDPKGLNVRALPSGSAKVVARLPGPRNDYGVAFRIVGYKDGWFLIEGADDPDYDDNAPKGQTIYGGRGWVSSRLVASSLAEGDLMSSPHVDAAVTLRLSGDLGGAGYGADSVPVREILECRGTWTRVRVEDPPTRRMFTGWVSRLCGNQVTTCP
jgi:hypothetical protein